MIIKGFCFFFSLFFTFLFFLDVLHDPGDLEVYIKYSANSHTRAYLCTLCGREFGQKPHVTNHLESIHFPNSFSYPCKHCGLQFNTKNKLYKHAHSQHKNQ